MAKVRWIFDGRKADKLAVARALAEAHAERLSRASEIREHLRAELGAEIDDRDLSNQTRRILRQEEMERRNRDRDLKKVGAAARKATREARQKPIYGLTNPFPLRENSARENRRFDTLFPLKQGSTRRSDGLYSFHCKFSSRGFGERREKRSHVYRSGEAVKHLRYIIRELAREISEGGLVSNISQEPGELAAFFDALEQLEAEGRDNANVYMSLVVSLPHELTPEGRERALGEVCDLLAEYDLPHVGVLHAPDSRGDPRNFHAHVMFSLRPCEITGPGEYGFSRVKFSELNDATFIKPFRHRVAEILNSAMEREGHPRRFTALSDADRELPPRTKQSGKSSPGQKHWERKAEDLSLMRREEAILARRNRALVRLEAVVREISAAASIDRSAVILAARTRTVAVLAKLKSNAAQLAPARAASIRALTSRTAIAGAARLVDLSERLGASKPVRGVDGFPPPAVASPSLPDQSQSVARAQPSAAPPEPRGSERRDAVAAAVWRLRQASFPHQVRSRHGYALAPSFVSALPNVDRFEAEPAIQAAHRLKWRQLLAAVGRRIEETANSPFFTKDGGTRLDPDFLPRPMQSALSAARGHDDIHELLAWGRRLWQEREAKARQKQERKEREHADRSERLGPPVRKMLGRIQEVVATRKISLVELGSIEPNIRIVARAVIESELVMRISDGVEVLYFADEGLRSIADELSGSSLGLKILRSLCKPSLTERFDPADLPVSRLLPPPDRPGSPPGGAAEGRAVMPSKGIDLEP